MMFDEQFLFDNFDKDEELQASNGDNQTVQITKKRKRTTSKEEEELGSCSIPQHEQLLADLRSRMNLIDDLERQNEKLKAVIKRLCGPQEETAELYKRMIENGDDELASQLPFAIVLMFNNSVSNHFQNNIDCFMRSLAQNDTSGKLSRRYVLDPQPSAVPLRAFASNRHGARRHISKETDFDPRIVLSTQYFMDYCLDRVGQPLFNMGSSLTDSRCLPTYEQVYRNALPAKGDAITKQPIKKGCFNCGGPHTLQSCTKTRDLVKINENRKSFMSNFSSPQIKRQRYHVTSGGSVGKEFKPGVVSSTLQEALGISDTEIPPYIYRMRELGYPPGYSMQAPSSSLLMYNEHGRPENSSQEEEGQLESPSAKPAVIHYPGFNAPLPPGVHDLFREYRVPPYSPMYHQHASQEFEASAHHFSYSPVAKDTQMDSMEIDEPEASPAIHIEQRNTPPPRDESYSAEDSFIALQTSDVFSPVEDASSQSTVLDSSNTTSQLGESYVECTNESLDTTCTSVVNTGDDDEREPVVSHRSWWLGDCLSTKSAGRTSYQPPPTCKFNIRFEDIPSNVITLPELIRDRNSTDLLDPLYGNLASPTGTYKNIKTTLKRRKSGRRR